MSDAEALPREHDPVRWFSEHFNDAADTILDFLGGDGISLEGKTVADIGAGDGTIDLGLCLKGRPDKLVGYDLRPTDEAGLLRAASAAGVAEELPDNLSFVQSEPGNVPAPDDTFDIVVTWSTFEHVDDPVQMLNEIRRILKPSGVLFLQLWPFWFSEHGGHLWLQYSDAFPHLTRDDGTILREIHNQEGTDPTRSADDEYSSLNRITLDTLQRALLANQLTVVKFRLITETAHIPPQLFHMPLSQLGIGGIELLAALRYKHAAPGED